MRTNDNKTTGAVGIEIQIFPRGMWYVIGAVVCMAVSLAILLVMIAILISQWVSLQVVLVVSLFLFCTCSLFAGDTNFSAYQGRCQMAWISEVF